MKIFQQPGESIPLAAPYDRLSGQGALVGALFGVAEIDVLSGATANFLIEGVVSLAKATGQTWTQGALIYWDNTNKNCTTTSTSNTRIGCAMQAQASGDTTGLVRLNGISTPTGA